MPATIARSVATIATIAAIATIATTAASVVVAAATVWLAHTSQLPYVFHFPVTVAFLSFWTYTWLLDARFTAAHWRYVMAGRETNPLINVIARRVTRGKAWPTLILHAAFIVTAAYIAAAAVSTAVPPADTAVPFSMLVTSAFLFMAGTGHVDALLKSREFVRSCEVRGGK